MSEETHSTEAASSHASEAAGDVTHAGDELHATVGHGDTGFQCGPGLPQMCIDTYASQIFWLAVTFIFLYVMMSRVTLPKIGRVIEERRDRIADDLGKAEDLKSQSEAAIQQYEQALADARAKAHVMAQETRDTLNAQEEERKGEVEAELNAKLEAAEVQIAATKEQALASIREVATDTAAAVVERLIGEGGSDAEVASAVDAALARRNG